MGNYNNQKTKRKPRQSIKPTSNALIENEKTEESTKKIAESELSEDSKAELRLLYTLAVSDAKFVKEQQWRIINYVIAAYITIYGIWKTVIPSEKKYLHSIEFWIMITFGIVICISGLWLIKIEQALLNRSRGRIQNVIKNFTKTFDEAFNDVKPDVSESEKSASYFIQQSIIFFGFLSLVYSITWI